MRSTTSVAPLISFARHTTTSDGRDGFVSFECTPDLADDSVGTVAQAVELWDRLARPNVMIKVPATEAGVPAIEELTALGVNVNVTLLFSVARYEQVIDAYIAGLEHRARTGDRVDSIASVASFFVSRVDTKIDALLPEESPLAGRVAIVNARQAYTRYRDRFSDARWRLLREAGARPQRPLWASTGTKNPAYSDLLYVEQLIMPDVVNTMPEATLRAFADHGESARIAVASDADSTILASVEHAGIDLTAVTADLEREGVRAFCASYRDYSPASPPRCITSRCSRCTSSTPDRAGCGHTGASDVSGAAGARDTPMEASPSTAARIVGPCRPEATRRRARTSVSPTPAWPPGPTPGAQ